MSAVLCASIIGCGTTASPPTTQEPDAPTVTKASDAGPSADAGATVDSGRGDVTDAEAETGLRGVVVNLKKAKRARVFLYRAGERKALWSAKVDGEGRFHGKALEVGTYRVVIPGDGVHGTADMYATIAPDGGVAEVKIHRPAGCNVKITVQDPAEQPLEGASLELVFPDLDHVAFEDRAKLTGTTDDEGITNILGSCVRGHIKGTITAPGRDAHDFRHGYMGNGRDNFVVKLPPPPDAGPADGGVSSDASSPAKTDGSAATSSY